MVRRQTARRVRVMVVSMAAVVIGVRFVSPGGALPVPPAPLGEVIDTATSGGAIGPRAALFRSLPPSAVSPWKRPGSLLRRDRDGDARAYTLGSDLRLRERHASLDRWHRIYSFSAKYRIKPDLARRIYDAAVTAGIEPELGFRLVRVESVFDTKAVSPVGALGLTQLMPSTAREFEPAVTREQLLTADVNLRIGFRYLRALIREYKGDLKLALLVYNRGPAAVDRALAMGQSPANGYESMVTKGYRGRGTLE